MAATTALPCDMCVLCPTCTEFTCILCPNDTLYCHCPWSNSAGDKAATIIQHFVLKTLFMENIYDRCEFNEVDCGGFFLRTPTCGARIPKTLFNECEMTSRLVGGAGMYCLEHVCLCQRESYKDELDISCSQCGYPRCKKCLYGCDCIEDLR